MNLNLEKCQAELRWLKEFEAAKGRPLRVLHVGNIANNAYKNAKVLNQIGIQAEVLCYDYFHIMGCPEWEDAEFDFFHDDHFRPTWFKKDLENFKRPQWFIQGRLISCLRHIEAKFNGKQFLANFYWFVLCLESRIDFRESRFIDALRWFVDPIALLNFLRRLADPIIMRLSKSLPVRMFLWFRIVVTRGLSPDDLRERAGKKTQALSKWPFVCNIIDSFVIAYSKYFSWGRRPPTEGDTGKERRLCQLFNSVFPTRPDQLTETDAMFGASLIDYFARIFNHYDLVQCYSVDPIFPLLSGKRPFIGFEHGTLRTFTQEPTTLNRLTSLAYNQADHVFITNGDCLEYAKKIGVTRFSPMIHPLDSTKISSLSPLERPPTWIGKKVFLCPLRHDWKVKGTDLYIRALPLLRQHLPNNFLVVFTKWGEQVDESIKLARDLGVSDLIEWVDPLPKIKLLRSMKASDVVLDQLALPHFGATAPEALAAGVPVIMSYRPDSASWIIPEPAPILPAFTVEDIVAQIETALDPAWRAEFAQRARNWIDAHHSDERVAEIHLKTYCNVLKGNKKEYRNELRRPAERSL